jgi:hypothetical protein
VPGTVEEKEKGTNRILEEKHRGMNKHDFARKYGISSSALSTSIEDRGN